MSKCILFLNFFCLYSPGSNKSRPSCFNNIQLRRRQSEPRLPVVQDQDRDQAGGRRVHHGHRDRPARGGRREALHPHQPPSDRGQEVCEHRQEPSEAEKADGCQGEESM